MRPDPSAVTVFEVDWPIVAAGIAFATVFVLWFALKNRGDHPPHFRNTFRSRISWAPVGYLSLIMVAFFAYHAPDRSFESYGTAREIWAAVAIRTAAWALGIILLTVLGRPLSARLILAAAWAGLLVSSVSLMALSVWTSTTLLWVTEVIFFTVAPLIVGAAMLRIIEASPEFQRCSAMPTMVFALFASGVLKISAMHYTASDVALPLYFGLPGLQSADMWWFTNLDLVLCTGVSTIMISLAVYRMRTVPDRADPRLAHDRIVKTFN